MAKHTPKKPSQEWLDHIKNNYTYDREKGQVFNNKTGKPALAPNSGGYLRVDVKLNKNRKTIRAHHLVWFFEYGEWVTSELDHIDGNKLNNHYTNLRQVTSRENIHFYHRNRKTSSKYTGVTWDKNQKKWFVRVYLQQRHNFLGRFDCELEAARAYDKALVSIGLDPVNFKMEKSND